LSVRYQSYNNGGNYFWLGIFVFFAFGGLRTLFLLVGILLSLFPFLLFFGTILWGVRKILKNGQIGGAIKGFGVQNNQFVELFVRISIQAIKADGHVDQREIDSLKSFFRQQMRYQGHQLQFVEDLIKTGLKQTYSLNELCDEFKQQFSAEPCYVLLDMVYRIISIDGVITKSEQTMADQIADYLDVPAQVHSRIKSAYQKFNSNTDQYYAVLGVTKTVTKEALKKAYRTASKEHHPDRVQHLGENIRKMAEEKIKQINEAYTYLNKQMA
jgi:DnaJ like chaperone protein